MCCGSCCLCDRAGGVDEAVAEPVLQAAFVPFGEVIGVEIPKEAGTQRPRGFGFVEFEDPRDALAAVDNMNHSELYGRVIKCSIARPGSVPSTSGKAGTRSLFSSA